MCHFERSGKIEKFKQKNSCQRRKRCLQSPDKGHKNHSNTVLLSVPISFHFSVKKQQTALLNLAGSVGRQVSFLPQQIIQQIIGTGRGRWGDDVTIWRERKSNVIVTKQTSKKIMKMRLDCLLWCVVTFLSPPISSVFMFSIVSLSHLDPCFEKHVEG